MLMGTCKVGPADIPKCIFDVEGETSGGEEVPVEDFGVLEFSLDQALENFPLWDGEADVLLSLQDLHRHSFWWG